MKFDRKYIESKLEIDNMNKVGENWRKIRENQRKISGKYR